MTGKKRTTLPLLCAATLFTPSLHAGGLYLYELSTTETSLAGAGWAARAQDPTTVVTNPAGMSRLEGTQLQFTLQPLAIDSDFSSDLGGGSSLDSVLPGGSFFATHQLNQEWTIGFSMAGFFGLGLDYDSGWEGRYYLDEITLQSIGFQPTVSYKVNDQFSVGAGITLIYTVFEQKMSVNNPGPASDGRLDLDDEVTSLQANVGFLYEPNDHTRFGLQYLSESNIDLKTRPDVKGNGLVSDALRRIDKLDLGMTMPQSVIFSAYHQINDCWAVMGNVGWQEWSKFGKVDIDASAANTSRSITANRRYKDTWNVSLGAQYQVNDQWRINTGIAYDSEMVDEKNVTFDLPTAESWRYGIGATYTCSENLEFSAGYEIVWYGDIDISANRGLAGNVSGTFEDHALHFLSFSVNWKL
ncbi:transporter [Verrucomicrobiaceae bacterium N1E253]|uniref:Transporter n=1 Tax=Oceaniferula marina TaxID=2748318 RepID=A0A851GGR7_9BACT|nr:OmpP1/FadL family transporter [Oceaniferula marina]NWK56389.1 transporter [Oceaniferula marina]